jgi:hypothetical protein
VNRYALVLALSVAACTQLPDVPSGMAPYTGDMTPSALLAQKLGSIGCTAVEQGTSQAEVTVPLPDGSMAVYSCPNANRATIHRQLSAYRSELDGTGSHKVPSMQTYYVNVVVYYQCEVTHHWNYVPAMGEYVYAYTTVNGCWITEIHFDDPNGGGAGGWYNNGTPTSPPSAPYSPPIVADTICFDEAGDPSVLVPHGTSDTSIVSGPLNDLAIADSIRDLFISSYGPLSIPLPQDQRMEIGAAIYQDSTNGPLRFIRLSGGPLTSKCSFDWTGTSDSIPRGAPLVALVHTHPFIEGEKYLCPIYSETDSLEATYAATGGGSSFDWMSADLLNLPLYTVDPQTIYRLNPGVDSLARSSNPFRWEYGTSGSCAPRQPL